MANSMANNKNAAPEAAVLDTARILHIDALCVVVNKLCGEAVEGAGKGMGDLPLMTERCLSLNQNILPVQDYSDSAGLLSPPVAVHRLDVPVTGCALFARTQAALVSLNAAFADSSDAHSGAVEKRYWAIIEKPHSEIPPAATLVHFVRHDPKKNKSIAFDIGDAHGSPAHGKNAQAEPKKAVLAYRVVGSGTNYLFLEIDLITGRHHQIRCQFERMGLYIKGDLKYGARRSEPAGGIRLHARSLAFPHPQGKGRFSVCADPPLMDNLWQAFMSCQ